MKAVSIAIVLVGCGIPICRASQEMAAPEKQLDFWIGDWTVTDTTPHAKNPPGTNVIRQLYGGKVIHESFKMGTFEGQSWSVFNPKTKTWQQTWVDNNGGYIAMASKTVNGNVAIQTLKREASPNTASRMVFTNVRPNSFTWTWEATADGGKTWTLSWRLQYSRKRKADGLDQALMEAIRTRARLEVLPGSWGY